MKKILLSFLMMATPFCAAYATAEDAEIASAFTVADIFPNGLIDIGEFDIYNLKVFESLDMDLTNSLDSEECSNDCFPNNITMNETSGLVVRYPFRVLDSNHDGSINANEYLAHGRGQFTVYDDDRNSSLDKKEFSAFYQGVKDRTFIAEKSNGNEK